MHGQSQNYKLVTIGADGAGLYGVFNCGLGRIIIKLAIVQLPMALMLGHEWYGHRNIYKKGCVCS